MRRIFSNYAYGPEPRLNCWWDNTCTPPNFPELGSNIKSDIAIIGGGFTGLNAAYHLAMAGLNVTVLEAQNIGWGASGRNGGFCCLGGGVATDAMLDKHYGREERLRYRQTEVAAISHVENMIETLGLDVDRHSDGETELAHRPRHFESMRKSVDRISENYGVSAKLIEGRDLGESGMRGPFSGALTIPVGFGLNPRKYANGLAEAAHAAGANIFEQADVLNMIRQGSKWRLETDTYVVEADQVIVATNGYSSETLPAWLAGRYMPVQSNVIVTRPLTDAEQSAQGWTTSQMAYDSRNLLHYFRLMPDGRFLFGLRGGLLASPHAENRAHQAAIKDFKTMFPAWSEVDITHRWSGMACLSRNQTPFVGPVPGMQGVLAGLAYHGNGVAMGSYVGKALAHLASDALADFPLPQCMTSPPKIFPFGAARRVLMPAAYIGLMLQDL